MKSIDNNYIFICQLTFIFQIVGDVIHIILSTFLFDWCKVRYLLLIWLSLIHVWSLIVLLILLLIYHHPIFIILLTHAIIVLNSCILKLSYFMKFFKCYEFLFEIFVVEFFKVVITKDFIIFHFFLQESSYFRCSHLAWFECLGCFLSSAIPLIFFMFVNIDSSFEKAIFMCIFHNFLF